jgi:hypothetical protein
MLELLLGSLLYPNLVKQATRWSPIHGALLGTLLAFAVGYFMPTIIDQNKVTSLTPMSINAGGGQFDYNAMIMDENNRIQPLDLDKDNCVLTINPQLQADQVRLYRGTRQFANSWMYGFGIWPRETVYSVEVSPSKAGLFCSPQPGSLLFDVMSPTKAPSSTGGVVALAH